MLRAPKAGKQGASHYAKISWKFRSKRKLNASVPVENFPVKLVHLQTRSSLTSRSGPTETCHFSFAVPLHLLESSQHYGRNVNGTLRAGWKFCFFRTMSLHVPLVSSTGL